MNFSYPILPAPNCKMPFPFRIGANERRARIFQTGLYMGWRMHGPSKAFFYIFIFFIFVFTKIYVRLRNLHEYTPTAPLPGGRDLASRQPSDRDLNAKKKKKKNYRQVPGDRSPGRPAAGRPAPRPYIRVLDVPLPSFALLKIYKKRKKREGGRGGVR